MFKNNNFQISLLFAREMAFLKFECFLAKKGLGPLGVKKTLLGNFANCTTAQAKFISNFEIVLLVH